MDPIGFREVPSAEINHYAVLGLDRDCTPAQIRSAYRILAKQHHPDLNPGSLSAVAHTREINAAYEILGNSERRLVHDRTCATLPERPLNRRTSRTGRNISQEVSLRPEEFIRGTELEVRVSDPGNPVGPETFPLIVPPGTAPGTQFRIPRQAPMEGGFVRVKARVRPDFNFKVRGSDLRRDLKISLERAAQGGSEMLRGVTGSMLRLVIPRAIGRGEILRIPGEGLPKARGGRGDLLVRVTYRPDVRITRKISRRNVRS